MSLKKTILYGLLLIFASGIGAIIFERLIVPQLQTVPWLRGVSFFDPRAPIVITQREEIHIDSGVNVQEVVNRARGSLVKIYVTDERLAPARPVQMISGVVATNDGLILAPEGVVRRGDDVTVVLSSGTAHIGRVIYVDPVSGIGFIKIPARDLPVLNESSARGRSPGEPLLMLSLEEGQGVRANTVELIAAAMVRPNTSQIHNFSSFETALELDGELSEADLGSVLVDKDGSMAGFVSGAGGKATPLRLDDVQMVIDNFLEHRSIEVIWPQPRLSYFIVGQVEAELMGMPEKSGVVIRQGYQSLLPDDFVYEVEGMAISPENGFQQIIFSKKPGQKITLKLIRRGLEHEVEISL